MGRKKRINPKIGVEFISSDDIKRVYSQDASRWYDVEPLGVFFPRNTEEVSKCVRWVWKEGIPLTPRGGGSGLSGGAVPESGGVVISTEKMRWFEIEKGKEKERDSGLSVRVEGEAKGEIKAGGDVRLEPAGVLYAEPGAISGEIEARAKKIGLTLPAQPSSLMFSTIGGNVATDSAGLRSIKYSSAGKHVSEVEIVCLSGDVITLKGDDAKIIAGSEGTLGIITKVKMNLVELKRRKALFFIFPDDKNAVLFAFDIIANLNPSAVEFADRHATTLMLDGIDTPDLKEEQRSASSVIVEFEEDIPGYIDYACDFTQRTALEFGGRPVYVNDPWQRRKRIGPSLAKLRPFKINEDISLPISGIPDFLRFVRTLDIKCVVFGHIGVGILHTNLVFGPGEEKIASLEREKLFEYVVSEVGGALTGEHGIGISKQKFVPLELNENTREFMTLIKESFDPNKIFNPSHFPSVVRGCIDTQI